MRPQENIFNGRRFAEKLGRFIGDVMEIGCCLVVGVVYLLVHAVALLFVLRLLTGFSE